MKIKILKGTTKKIQFALKVIILLYVTFLAIMHQLKGILIAPPIHGICPFGGLESLFKLITEGHYIQKIFPATIVLLVGTILLAIIFRRAFCGWICPLGTLQEFFTYLGRKFQVKQNKIPDQVDKFLKKIKYIGLVLIIFFTWKTGELVFNAYDPWAAYGHLAAGGSELLGEFLVGTIFLAVGLIGSIWIPQNWCKYFCPMGAFLGIFSKISPVKISRNLESCITCHLCSHTCPMSLPVSKESSVESIECYNCGDCISVCPKENTLTYKVKNKRFSALTYGLIAFALFFATIQISKQLKVWSLGFDSFREVLTNDAGQLDPALIKGGMPIAAISKEFNIPMNDLKSAFMIPLSTSNDTPLKIIAAKNEKEVDEYRQIVKEILKKRE